MKKFNIKKIITSALVVTAMTATLMACGSKKDDNKETTTGNDNATTTTTTAQESADVIIKPEAADNTLGNTLWNAFLDEIKKNEAVTPEELAATLSTNPALQFKPMAGAVEAGSFLAGFDKEISGYDKGAVYAPMIGSIAFIGYVFELPADADVNAFIKNLNDNANPRWNICVSADYVLSGAYNNKVFFLMYPASFDEAANSSEENNGNGSEAAAVIIEPVVEADSWGDKLWKTFVEDMKANPSATAAEEATMLSMHETIPFMSGSGEVVPGYLAGFNEEMSGFKSGASFGPMIGSIAFIGYVFELEEGADVNAFINTLTSKANPGWNICVTAEQTVVGAYNNKVFFVMCPKSNGQQ